jgi:hypothetical protein
MTQAPFITLRAMLGTFFPAGCLIPEGIKATRSK